MPLPLTLEELPNVGKAVATDLRLLGIKTPADLRHKNGYDLYERLCKKTGVRHDPCMIDTFLAVVDFVQGAPARPWWHYTPMRKAWQKQHSK